VSSRTRISRKNLADKFKHRKGLLSRHRWKRFQEIVERISGFKIIEEVLHRDARADKDGLAALDVRIAMNDGVLNAMAPSMVETRLIHLGF